ncbi:MAG TPA: hypothetical protein VF782_06920 [Allosphingosinicella sp.]
MTGLAAARRFEAMRIVLFAMLAAIGYGILHDQVTAHLCVEYFTVAHPPVFGTESPFLLGLGWGILATWWVGLGLGSALAAAARLGSAPRLGLPDLRRPIVLLMTASALAALLAGLCGALFASTGLFTLPDDLASAIAPDRHVAFAAAAWAHTASYAAGGVGGVFLIIRTIRRRVRQPRSEPDGRPAPSAHGAAVARELEQRYGTSLPDDFKAYLTDSAPESDWMDNNGLVWWAPERIKNLPDERGTLTPPEQVNPEIEAEAGRYLVFADYLDWCYAYAVCCSDGPNRGKVALIGVSPDRLAAGSFSRFVELAESDSMRLHSPGGDHFTDPG